MIRTVLGDIPCNLIGHTQCHEHLFIEKGMSFQVNPALCMEDYQKSMQELNAYKDAGGTCVVDAQPVFCGRMPNALVDASSRTGVHIITVTGFHMKRFYQSDAPVFSWTEKRLSALFSDEVVHGMLLNSGKWLSARAGLIKAALETRGVYADTVSEKLFCAAASAAVKARVPLIIHTEPHADVLEMITFFTSAGIEPSRLIICHLDRTRYDFVYHKEVLSTGVYLCYDSINRLKYLSHERELALICAMAEAGFARQMLLSLDTTNQRLRAYGGDMGLDYILKTYIPMLQENGVEKGDIKKMTALNAREALRIK